MEEEVTSVSMEEAAAKSAVEGCVDPGSCVQPGCKGCAELYSRYREANSRRAYWQKMHAKAKEREAELKARMAELEAKLRKRERQLFGKKTERGGKSKGERSPKTKPEKQRKRGQQKGAKGHGRGSQGALPAEEEFHCLDEDDRRCPNCDGLYDDTGLTEDSEVVEVEVKAHRRRIRRRRYRRACDCPGPPRTLTAPRVPKLISKGAYGISFWVLVIGRKNFRGSGAVWAGQLLVMAMSLFQTLLAHDVDPRLWLSSYFERCAELGGIAPDDAARWLPWNLDDDERFELRPLVPQRLDTS